jgi:two-component system CheB/CheR fusion protein
VHEGIAVEDGGIAFTIDLIVEPVSDPGDDGACVVAFRDRGKPRAVAKPGRGGSRATGTPATDLEAQLIATRARLQATIDEIETANEEMMSANEEYQSVNEELQSANEELETSKEEMQSINEELQTVNAELNSKNEVLGRANSDLSNLLDSTQIATVFLDGGLCVTGFTPAMTELFHLRDGDRGRPITDIVSRLSYDGLKDDVERVLRTLAVVEREVDNRESGATFIMRIRPYRTADNVIDGVVITFVDITSVRRYQRELARLTAIVDAAADGIIGHAVDGTVTSWNAGAERLTGYAAAEALGKPMAMLLPPDRQADLAGVLTRVGRGESISHFTGAWLRKDGTRVAVSASIHPVTLDGANVEVSWIARRVAPDLAHAAENN